MLLSTTVLCLLLGLVIGKAREQQRFVNQCQAHGWRVYYEYEASESGMHRIELDRATNSPVFPSPVGPEIVRRILGDAYFNKIRGIDVRLEEDTDHELLTQLASRSSITFLRITGTFQKKDLAAIASLPRLAKLEIDLAALSPDEIRSIRRFHPQCDVYIRQMQR